METKLIIIEVFLLTILSNILIVLFRSKAMYAMCNSQWFKKIVEHIAIKYFKYDCYFSSNGYGYCIFNRKHKHGEVFKSKENWYYKVIIGNKWLL